jgi:phosphomevalonate kinase
MRARAPGKLVLSGAYSVLERAPALVAAVDRYVVADTARAAEIVTAEVAEAVKRGLIPRAIGFDANALREPLADGSSRKLGLGSSAAILVATLAAFDLTSEDLRDALFLNALDIHRTAQGGGSGLDVAASCFGGVLRFQLGAPTSSGHPTIRTEPHRLPDAVFETWACPQSAGTSGMLARVRQLAAADPAEYAACIEPAKDAAARAAAARDGTALLTALVDQRNALARLGAAADIPIMTAEIAELHALALGEGACFYPSGAGGGDIALYAGERASSRAFRARAGALGLARLELCIGAPGVERL